MKTITLILLALLWLAAPVAAAGDDGWSWANPQPTGAHLNTIWPLAGGEVLIGGDFTLLRQEPGETWTTFLPYEDIHRVYDLKGYSLDDFYMASGSNYVHHWEYGALNLMVLGNWVSGNRMWLLPDVTGYLACSGADTNASGGSVMYLENNAWRSIWTGSAALTDLWGTDEGVVFAVGEMSQALRIEGTDVQQLPQIGDDNYFLGCCIWGVGAANLFTAGWHVYDHEYRMYHWDGTHWELLWQEPFTADDHDYPEKSWDMAGTAPQDLYWVGPRNLICHWDGAQTTLYEAPMAPRSGLRSLAIAADGTVTAVGDYGMIVRLNNGALSSDSSGFQQTVTGLWGTDSSTIFAATAGNGYHSWDGSVFQPMPRQGSGTPHEIAGLSADHAYACGYDEDEDLGFVDRWDGTAWQQWRALPGTRMTSLLALRTGEVIAGGWRGVVTVWDGTEWSDLPPLTGVSVGKIVGRSLAELYVLELGDGALWRWNGQAWSRLPETWFSIYDIWQASTGQVFAVGRVESMLGSIAVWNGAAWRGTLCRLIGDYTRVAGRAADDVYALVGPHLHRWDGCKWSIIAADYDMMAAYELWCSTDGLLARGGAGGGVQFRTLPDPGPPPCEATGVELLMPGNYFKPYFPCWLDALICNTSAARRNVPLFVLLEVAGEYFCYPSWRPLSSEGADYETLPNVPTGRTRIQIIPDFSWPENTGHADGLHVYAALVDLEQGALIGELGEWEFGF